MKFSTFTINGTKVEYPVLFQSKMADTSSRQSNRSLEILSYNLRTAQEAINLIYICSWYEFWQTDKIYRTIATRARQMKYNGKWLDVQRLLEEQITNPEEFYQAFLRIGHKPEEFWGNVEKSSRRTEYGIKFIDPQKEDRRKVRRTQRHRGYRDKGTYRFPHEKHGIPNYSEPIEDRYNKVRHPLLNLEEINTSKFGVVAEDHSQKGGIDLWF